LKSYVEECQETEKQFGLGKDIRDLTFTKAELEKEIEKFCEIQGSDDDLNRGLRELKVTLDTQQQEKTMIKDEMEIQRSLTIDRQAILDKQSAKNRAKLNKQNAEFIRLQRQLKNLDQRALDELKQEWESFGDTMEEEDSLMTECKEQEESSN